MIFLAYKNNAFSLPLSTFPMAFSSPIIASSPSPSKLPCDALITFPFLPSSSLLSPLFFLLVTHSNIRRRHVSWKKRAVSPFICTSRLKRCWPGNANASSLKSTWRSSTLSSKIFSTTTKTRTWEECTRS